MIPSVDEYGFTTRSEQRIAPRLAFVAMVMWAGTTSGLRQQQSGLVGVFARFSEDCAEKNQMVTVRARTRRAQLSCAGGPKGL